MNSLKVSIALCTYNGERFLKKQLDSLVNQSYQNIEIVVVDDCSKDNTLKILEPYITSKKILFYQNEVNLGFAKNFEKAISLCRGEMIALCDQDDIWDLEKIDLLLKNIKDNILIYHDSEMVDNSDNPLQKKLSDYRKFLTGRNNKGFIFSNSVSGHSVLFKRELLKYLFPIPEDFYHDWWMGYVASTVGKITFINQPLVKYRQHDQSYTDISNLRKKTAKGKRSKNIASPKARRELTQNIVKKIQKYIDFKYNSAEDIHFLKKLQALYSYRQDQYICPSLFIFLFKNRNTLFYAFNKSFLSKLLFFVKESIGDKLKNTFHSLTGH